MFVNKNIISKVYLKKVDSGIIDIPIETNTFSWKNPFLISGLISFDASLGQSFITKKTKKESKTRYNISVSSTISEKQPARSIAQPILNAVILLNQCTRVIINSSFNIIATENVTNLSIDVYKNDKYYKTLTLSKIGLIDIAAGNQSINAIYKWKFIFTNDTLGDVKYTFKNLVNTNTKVTIKDFYVNSVEEFKPNYNKDVKSSLNIFIGDRISEV